MDPTDDKVEMIIRLLNDCECILELRPLDHESDDWLEYLHLDDTKFSDLVAGEDMLVTVPKTLQAVHQTLMDALYSVDQQIVNYLLDQESKVKEVNL